MSKNIITLGDVCALEPGDRENPNWINEEFEAVITDVKAEKTKTGKAYYKATLRDPHDAGISIAATFFVAGGITPKQGKVCHFAGAGMKIEAYKDTPQLIIGDKTKISVIGTHAGTPAAVQSSSTTASKAPAGASILGATVGMAINQAIGILKECRPDGTFEDYYSTPEFSKDLHIIASDIIRISQLLEKSKLASPVKDRAPSPVPEPEPEQPPAAQQQPEDDGSEIPF
jgi:hypothetical protein